MSENKLTAVSDNELGEVAGGRIVKTESGDVEVYVSCPVCGESHLAFSGSKEKSIEIAEKLSCKCGHSWSIDITI